MLAVFDLDGTLIDSSRDLAESANEMLRGYGAPPLAEDRIISMVGCGAATLVARVVGAAGVEAPPGEALERFLQVYDRRLTLHTRPYAGIPEVLEGLRSAGVRLGMLTNKPIEPSRRILETFGLTHYFEWIVGGDGPLPRKPVPDGLRFIMSQAGVAPEHTLLVGDSSVDLETARNAGVRVCLARYGFGFRELSSSGLRGDEAIVDAPAAIAEVVYARR